LDGKVTILPSFGERLGKRAKLFAGTCVECP
jgi:hypothetical protein